MSLSDRQPMNKRNLIKTATAGVFAWGFGLSKAIAGDKKMKQTLHSGPFGTCCKDLKDAMESPPKSFFYVEKNKVLYLTVGYAQTKDGPGWFDQAVIFCPFCGSQLQTKEDIAKKAHG
jgi:hypothetical protein